MSAQGQSREAIMKAVFGVDPTKVDYRTANTCDCNMSRWRKLPEYEAIWKDEVKAILYGCTAEAIQTINAQLKAGEQAWLQNKAANDLLAYGKNQIYGDEERAIHVQIEGMPDLGSPDEE